MRDRRDGPLSEAAEPAFDEAPRGTRQRGMRPRPELDGTLLRRGALDADLEGTFKARATALGMGVRETPRIELRHVLDELVSHYGPAVVEPALLDTFPELGGVGDFPPDAPGLFTACCGITGVEYAIAETGSLVIASGAGKWRRLSFVPPVHVAVVERQQLVADLLDVLLAYGGRSLPSGFVVVTGPTRSAEMAPAHRPGTVECVFVA